MTTFQEGTDVPGSNYIPTENFENLPDFLQSDYRGEEEYNFSPLYDRDTPNSSYSVQSREEKDDDAPVVKLAGELRASTDPPPPKLLDPILLNRGLAALVGKADGGKSMLARQLAISIAAGLPTFLSLPLIIRTGKAIYLTTEDDEPATTACYHKQKSILSSEEVELVKKNLRFIFQVSSAPARLREELKNLLSMEPVDLVVIDGYGDMFEGRDANSMTDVRQMLAPYYAMANKYNCAILFISHPTKAGSELSPDQNFVIGSSAFTQKMRTVIELRVDKNTFERKLTVLKGNSMSDADKSKVALLELDPDTMTFSNTGRTIQRSQVGQQAENIKIDFDVIFDGHEELPAGEIIKKMKNSTASKKLAPVSTCPKILKVLAPATGACHQHL